MSSLLFFSLSLVSVFVAFAISPENFQTAVLVMMSSVVFAILSNSRD